MPRNRCAAQLSLSRSLWLRPLDLQNYLKFPKHLADVNTVRYERLVVDAGENQTFVLDFHPRLTVVTGVGSLEREGLTSELLGVLSSNRSGGALELVMDSDVRLAVFRPYGAKHMVVDVDGGSDISGVYADAQGSIDLLRAEGLDQCRAKRQLRVTGNDLSTSTRSAELIGTLASVDQQELWALAARVRESKAELTQMAEDAGSSPEDISAIEDVERRHDELERAQAGHEKIRRATFIIALICALAAVPLGLLTNYQIAIGVLAPAPLAAIWSIIQWRRMEAARKATQQALENAGADSYLGFHLNRVNTMLSSDQVRRELIDVAELHRRSAEEWMALVGDEVPVEWAIEHRQEVADAARVRQQHLTSAVNQVEVDISQALAEELVMRFSAARKLGTSGESFPIVLDEPFSSVEPTVKAALLELLLKASGDQQLILLTEDRDIGEWARVEALTGALSIVEPAKNTPKLIDATDASTTPVAI